MTSLSQRIAALQAQRGRLVARFEGLITRALDEDREFDDEENEERLTLRGQIEALDRRIETHAADETILARQALPIPVVYPGNTPGTSVVLRTQRERPQIQMRRNDDYKGAGFTRWAIAMCVAGPWNAAEYARQRWGDDELADIIAYANWFARAAPPPIGTGPSGPGGPGEGLGGPLGGASLIRLEHLGEEFIELLRPAVDRRAPAIDAAAAIQRRRHASHPAAIGRRRRRLCRRGRSYHGAAPQLRATAAHAVKTRGHRADDQRDVASRRG